MIICGYMWGFQRLLPNSKLQCVNIIVGGSNSYTSDPGKQHASSHLRISSSSSYQNKVIWLSVDICEVFTFYFKIRNYSLWIELILVIRQTNAYLDHSFSSHRWVVRGVPEVYVLPQPGQPCVYPPTLRFPWKLLHSSRRGGLGEFYHTLC